MRRAAKGFMFANDQGMVAYTEKVLQTIMNSEKNREEFNMMINVTMTSKQKEVIQSTKAMLLDYISYRFSFRICLILLF